MEELRTEAKIDKLSEVLHFVEEILERNEASIKAQMHLMIAAEEIFVNIANYAYGPEGGMAELKVCLLTDPKAIEITFMDEGIPYNPLEHQDPDITLNVNDREIGGLGIYMTKKMMDDVSYSYVDGKNTLRIRKRI